MNRQSSADLPMSTDLKGNLGRKTNSGPDSSTALETALATLRTGDFQSRWDAAKAIPAFGEMAIVPLLNLLQSELATEAEDEELSWFVARILGNINHPTAIDSLICVLHSTDNAEVTAVAAIALAGYGFEAITPLTNLLDQPATRLIAVQALAQIQHAAIIQPLLTVVDDASTEVRSAAIEALSHFYDPVITDALRAALRDPDTSVRRAAVVALGIQAEQGNCQILTEMLSPLLWDLNLEVGRQAAIALGRLGTAAAIAALSQGLQSAHTSTTLQLDIVQALSWIGTVAALDPLRQFLNTSASVNLVVEQTITAVLGRVEDPQAQQTAGQMLLELLRTSHPIAQTPQGLQQIARSLGQLRDPQSIEALIALLAEPDASVRLHVIAALKQLEAAGSYQQLRALSTQALPNRELKAGIEMALREWQSHMNME